MKQVLTPLQEKFCQAVASGKGYTEAYKLAGYSTKNMKPDTVNRSAFALTENHKIIARVKELRDQMTRKLEYSAIESFDNLKKILQEALAKGQLSAAIKAEELCGKLAGLYVEKLARTDTQGNDLETPLVNNEDLLEIMERRKHDRCTEGTTSD